MIPFAKFMIKFEEETDIFIRYDEEFVKTVFVKPRFCMRVFIVKNEGTESFIRYNEEFFKNHIR